MRGKEGWRRWKLGNRKSERLIEAWKRMKNGKAVGPDDMPVEVWKREGSRVFDELLAHDVRWWEYA